MLWIFIKLSISCSYYLSSLVVRSSVSRACPRSKECRNNFWVVMTCITTNGFLLLIVFIVNLMLKEKSLGKKQKIWYKPEKNIHCVFYRWHATAKQYNNYAGQVWWNCSKHLFFFFLHVHNVSIDSWVFFPVSGLLSTVNVIMLRVQGYNLGKPKKKKTKILHFVIC